MHKRLPLSLLAVSAVLAATTATGAHAASRDSDRDGIPNRFERSHGMNPRSAADARRDFDRDGLTNLREYRLGTKLRDEDTDNDGHDDGDEVKDGYRSTKVKDADSDDDGIRDGDEDADRDGIDNEDEDDARESCRRDDDDRDGDDVDDEDENDYGLKVRRADSDRDGISDGDEDHDEDGQANEDDDDSDDDACDDSDEDEGDLFGTITSFDAETGALVVTALAGFTVSGLVTEDTEVEFEDATTKAEREGTHDDLAPGVTVAELEIEEAGPPVEFDKVEIYRSLP